MQPDPRVERNVRAHDAIARRYDRIHGEIFNPVEQQRLHDHLERALAFVETDSHPGTALDFGCGSGNLTRHLLDLDLHVTAADVSPKFLRLVEATFGGVGRGLETVQLNGHDLSNLPDGRFDLVATYSVLHHVPDYLRIVEEMVRVTRPGGVIFLDHEVNEAYWQPGEEYRRFQQLVSGSQRWAKYTNPANYIGKIRRLLNPRYHPEGDIHVWPDDHIEWPAVRQRLEAQGCRVVLTEDYLLYKRGFPRDVYDRYKDLCADMRLLVARRDAQAAPAATIATEGMSKDNDSATTKGTKDTKKDNSGNISHG